MSIKQIIQELLKNDEEIYSLKAKVLEVNESERTCTVEPLNGDAEVTDVLLQGAINREKGCVLIPSKDSIVIINWLSKDVGYVALTTEIDRAIMVIPEIEIKAEKTTLKADEIDIDCQKVKFNKGTNKGLIIEAMIKAEFAAIQANFTAIQAGWAGAVITPTDGGATVKTSMIAATSAFQPIGTKKLTNDKVQH